MAAVHRQKTWASPGLSFSSSVKWRRGLGGAKVADSGDICA